MIINSIEKNLAKIIIVLGISPGSRYSRDDLIKRTEMNNAPFDEALAKLSALNLIIREKNLYCLNLGDKLISRILEEQKPLSYLPIPVQMIILEFTDMISRFRHIKKVILFGSYSKLIFSERSDIDIAIITANNLPGEKQIRLERQVFPIKNKISKKYKKEIETHYFSEADLKHKEDALIKDIIRNGRVLI